jgi:hypothetical protein
MAFTTTTYLTSDNYREYPVSITSRDVTTALGYTPYNASSPTEVLNTIASNTDGAGFNLTVGVAPTNPREGDIWVADGNMYVFLGGTTQIFSLTPII